MGAFKDLLDILRASVGGLVPFGGTLNPVSESVPVAFAQNIKGNLAVYPTLDTLADIPYDLLVLDMEAIVREYTLPDTSLHERARYRLVQLPSPGTKVNDIPGYNISDYWEPTAGGSAGEPGAPGQPGFNGWSPTYALEDDGPQRVVERFYSWVGGTGTAPTVPTPPDDYRGSTGFVAKSLAINVKGPQGPPGNASHVAPPYYRSIGLKHIGEIVASTGNRWSSLGVVAGQFASVSETLVVSNTDIAGPTFRSFLIFGEVPVCNDPTGDDAVVVRLCEVADATPTPPAPTGTLILDENYSLQYNYVYQAPTSYHNTSLKVNVRARVELYPNQTKYFKLYMTIVKGSDTLFKKGFIEVFAI